MRIIGIAALAVVALVVLSGIVVGLVSIPDLKRYQRIRSM